MNTPNTFNSDTVMSIHGVEGRLKRRTVGPHTAAGCFEHQDWTSYPRPVNDWGPGRIMKVDLRFDDACHNGHNTFAITAYITHPGTREARGDWDACGCLHDEIRQYFPELAHLIPWHGCTTDGPLHYVANTLYLAGDRDCNGKRKGEILRTQPAVRFGNIPAVHTVKPAFATFLRSRIGTGTFTVTTVPYKPTGSDTYPFSPKYTLAGYDVPWHSCPFDTLAVAECFCESLNSYHTDVVDIPVAYSEGGERDLDAARSTAIWPAATDEQLSAEPDVLRSALLDRLPALLDSFHSTMADVGFYWAPEDCPAE